MESPNGPADVATFGFSTTTNVSISANTEVNGITFTSAATNPYNITASPGLTLTISGTGITNNSGRAQSFEADNDASGNIGTIVFSNSATAGGSNVSIFSEGGSIKFFNRSTAGSAVIDNFFSSRGEGGSMNFFDHSTAGNSTIIEEGNGTNFFNWSTAGSARIQMFFGSVSFNDHSSAGSASFGVPDDSRVSFSNSSTAGNAFFAASGEIGFLDSSTAGSAVIDTAGYLFFRIFPRWHSAD
jgi:fibronectin-binding autotransporter adhesin